MSPLLHSFMTRLFSETSCFEKLSILEKSCPENDNQSICAISVSLKLSAAVNRINIVQDNAYIHSTEARIRRDLLHQSLSSLDASTKEERWLITTPSSRNPTNVTAASTKQLSSKPRCPHRRSSIESTPEMVASLKDMCNNESEVIEEEEEVAQATGPRCPRRRSTKEISIGEDDLAALEACLFMEEDDVINNTPAPRYPQRRSTMEISIEEEEMAELSAAAGAEEKEDCDNEEERRAEVYPPMPETISEDCIGNRCHNMSQRRGTIEYNAKLNVNPADFSQRFAASDETLDERHYCGSSLMPSQPMKKHILYF